MTYDKYLLETHWLGLTSKRLSRSFKQHVEYFALSVGNNCSYNQQATALSLSIYSKYGFFVFLKTFCQFAKYPANYTVENETYQLQQHNIERMISAATIKIAEAKANAKQNYLTLYKHLCENPPAYFDTFFNTKHLSCDICSLITEYIGPVPMRQDFINH